jgi:hypothetical protein
LTRAKGADHRAGETAAGGGDPRDPRVAGEEGRGGGVWGEEGVGKGGKGEVEVCWRGVYLGAGREGAEGGVLACRRRRNV